MVAVPVAKRPQGPDKIIDDQKRPTEKMRRWMQKVDTVTQRTSGVQDQSAALDQISALTLNDDDIIQQKAGELANRTIAKLWADLVPTVALSGLPAAASNTSRMYFVTDETGGPTLVFSDGTNWLRVTDGATAS